MSVILMPMRSREPSSHVSRVTEVMATKTPPARGPMRNRLILMPEPPARVDPLIALVEDWFRAPGGFPTHPHRGFETVTLVLDGEVAHEDTMGHRALLEPGDVQWMTAGRGVLHSEMPHGDVETHVLQLWLNLPAAAKRVGPRYQDLRANAIPIVERPGVSVRVVSGEVDGIRGPAENIAPVTYLDVSMAAGARVSLPVPARHRGLAYVLSGELALDARPVRASEVALLTSGAEPEIPLIAASRSRLIVIAGRPIGEPVVARGPFVMNSEEEIVQAYADLRSGRFARASEQSNQ